MKFTINYWNNIKPTHEICYQDFYSKTNFIEFIYLDEEEDKNRLPKQCVGIWRIKNKI